MRHLLIFILGTIILADESWKIYDDSTVGRVDITVDSTALIWMYNNVESDSLHMAEIHFDNNNINETVENVGFRLRGNTSRNSQKKSFKLDFNHFVQGRNFYDVEKINLNGEHNDVSILRSKLCWDLFHQIGIVSSRACHMEVYINEEYYGLYISVEHIDDTFLYKNYANDSGNLWKCIWPADLTYRGLNPQDYHPWIEGDRPYELKTNKDDYNFYQLARLINIINNDIDSLEHIFDISLFIKYLAINILTGSWDDYRSLRNNFYLYHDPSIDRFHLIPYDYDNVFGVDWFDVDWATIDPYSYYLIDDSDRPLADIIFDNDSYQNLFSHFLSFYMDYFFSLDLWNDWIDSTKSMIDTSAFYDVYRTFDYGFTFDDFNNSYSEANYTNQHIKRGLKEFFVERTGSLENQLNYITANPLVYDVISEPQFPHIGDSITIHASAFGSPEIDHINVIVHTYNNGSYESYNLENTSIPESNILEEADRWTVKIPPIGLSGKIGLRFLITNINEITGVSPITGEWPIKIVSPAVTEGIVINEFLSSNDAINTDEFDEFDDWLELYNTTFDTIYLMNHYLTDNPEHLTKWTFPETNILIAPQEYLLIWCDNDEEQGDLHTNFKLSTGGEFLAIVNPDGQTIIDSITFNQQTTDISFGRFPDGSENWSFLMPTPLSTNQPLETIDDYLPKNFSLAIYPNPFNSSTQIQYNLNENAFVNIVIYDLLGREQKTLLFSNQSIGQHIISWNGLNNESNKLSSGIWLVSVQVGKQIINKKILLLK